MSALRETLAPLAEGLYDEATIDRLIALAERWRPTLAGRRRRHPDESTAYLIAYGDAFSGDGQSSPLAILREVLDQHVGDAVTDVHLLPVYPWTSDDGFGVVDHREIDPSLGTWDDVSALAADRGVALDFVANHVSASHAWFRGWLASDPRYDGFFLAPDDDVDVSRVTRPRTTPLTHPFLRPDGTAVDAWTTFGPDQVDVDPSEPGMLLELTDVLLGYLARGASTIRLDAIGYLWKKSGTTSLHLAETHAVIRMWRAIIDDIAPGALLLTETNVPHADNVTYFGGGDDEANMVYQFALPPLVLHSFVTGDTAALSRWAAAIGPVSATATWFDFLASHDGIGLRPTEGLLDDDDRARLVERALASGGQVSLARRPDGTEGVYELNVNYLDALVEPGDRDPDAAAVVRGLAAHAILLSLIGVPAIYFHSLFGSTGDPAAAAASGIPRRVNRATIDTDELEAMPARRRGMLDGLLHLLRVRRTLPGLSPFADQRIETPDPRVVVIRRAPGTSDEVVAVVNVTGEKVSMPALSGTDALTGIRHDVLALDAFQYVWLRPDG